MRVVLTFLLCAIAAVAQLPRPAGELTWTGHDGSAGSLSKHKGKIVVVEILSTGCPHCQDTAVMLAKLAPEFAPKGVQIQGVAVNDDANPAAFIKEFKLNFPVGKANKDKALGFLQQSMMRPFYFPGLVFIDRNGIIQAQYSGADAFAGADQAQNLRKQIEKMVGESAPAKPAAAPKAAKKAS
jgi:peroxiredoxin